MLFRNLAKQVRFLLVAMCLWGVSGVQAEVFRWVDENGKVHFGDRPPAGQKTQTLEFPEADPADEAPGISDDERKLRQKKLVQMLEEERLAKEKAKQEAKEEAEKQAQYCERFKNRLTYLERYNRIYDENDDGTRTYLSDKDADAYKAEVRAKYRKECLQN